MFSRANLLGLNKISATFFLAAFFLHLPIRGQDEIEIYDNEPSTTPRMTPEEAVQNWRLPEGFSVSLYAAEPDVQQPISMCWDAQGRMWVVENYTYADAQTNFDNRLNDRVLVFTDTNGDGRFDERKVFWDQGKRVTSIEIGHGGVWLLAAPNLLFIPDKNADAQADGEPTIVLDGFDADRVRHNLVNGLRWGPDGWLYGRHGILATSFVGKPGSELSERVALNCGVWRYHPNHQKFEVYTHGTTNPWGMDWNDNGELFFINTVIGHLWHAVPGAHVERMYGEDLNPYVFGLIPQTADHVHWDAANEKWMDIRKIGVSDQTDKAGGGHAHCGLMFYLGDNWPQQYRNELFTLNLHGRRINQDHIERDGAAFTGKHRPDFAFSPDPWFRAIDLTYGPDGAVYILDWSDAGECHENDGVHRHSGRIFRIAYNQAKPQTVSSIDLSILNNQQLINLFSHSNEWYVRQARQLLADRHSAGVDVSDIKLALTKSLEDTQTTRLRLRALWGLNAIDGTTPELLSSLMLDQDEAIAAAAIRLTIDSAAIHPDLHSKYLDSLLACSQRTQSSLALLYLASSLQYVDGEKWWELAGNLISKGELAGDRTYPLLLWYGVEKHVARSPDRALNLLKQSKIPQISAYIVRRLGIDVDQWAEPLNSILAWAAESDSTARQVVLEGLSQASAGRIKFPPLTSWEAFATKASAGSNAKERQQILEIGLLFGEGRSTEELLRRITDGSIELPARRQAIAALARQRSNGLREVLVKLVGDRDLGVASIDALTVVGGDAEAQQVLASYPNLQRAAKEAALRLLASRRETAELLLAKISDNSIPRQDIQATTLRQLQILGDDAWNERIKELFPETRKLDEDKRQRMVAIHAKIQEIEKLPANPSAGRTIFDNSCAKCHRLFGSGSQIGPELTGSQRSNLNYLIENLVDPSAQLADTYRTSVLRLQDGRVLMGVVLQRNEKVVALQTAEEKLSIPAEEIEEMQQTNKSLMPEGLLDSLSDQQLRDLFAYLQSTQQVAPLTQ